MLLELAYQAALGAARPLLLAAPIGGKLGQGLRGRRGAADRLLAWAAAERRAGAPLVWFHAPSLGEALMAQATIAALRAERPDAQIAFTFFSPSAERVAGRVGADVADYLDWDLAGRMRALIGGLRPAAIAFIRTEIWPVLTREAERAGTRLAMLNAVLPPDSSRLRPAARLLLGPAYRRLDAVGAVSDADALRFARLGVPAARTSVTGDARFDQVWARLDGAAAAARDTPGRRLAERLASGAPLLVAGSTWPADEERLVPAVAAVRARGPLRLVVAPHEPTPAHLELLEGRLDDARLPHARLSAWEPDDAAPPPDVLVVDRIGVLADLYAAGRVAYVGGGFGRAGLHSVIEPAAWGVPVLFGPRAGAATEADRLAAAGGGFPVSAAADIAERLLELLDAPDRRDRAAAAARGFVERNLGAAARNAALLLALLGDD